MDRALVDIIGENWQKLHLSPLVVPEDYKSGIKPVLPKKAIGIEVEVENVRRAAFDQNMWGTKEDGSLRNNGIEFVSCPLAGKQIEIAVRHLFSVLPIGADFSERTSIHVHLNMRDSLVKDLLNLLLLYISFEKCLYRFAGEYRYRNIFCVPLQETQLPIILSNFIANGDLLSLIKQWQKYSGLNLLPLIPFGTVEFRQMHGHRDPDLLLNWINIIFRMFKYSKKYSFDELFNYIRTLNSTSKYEEFLTVVFEKEAELINFPKLKQAMEPGVSTIKMVSKPSMFVQQLISQIDNNSELLKSLGISVKSTLKEPSSLKTEFKPGFWDVYNFAQGQVERQPFFIQIDDGQAVEFNIPPLER